MPKWKKLAHVIYQCSYHIVWTPKYRYRILEGDIARMVEHKIRTVCEWKGIEILELNIRKDHVHMVATIPPRISNIRRDGDYKGEDSDSGFQGAYESKGEAILGESFLE